MEKILAIPETATGANAMTSLTDCNGNAFAMNTAPGPWLLPSGSTPSIDYTQPPVANYSMTYVTCSGLSFDVRWRIDSGPTRSTQLVTVSVKSLRNAGAPAAVLARKFTLRSLRGN
jgi:hypothetical protein